MSLLSTPLTLANLPLPPAGKTGWPWTKQTEPYVRNHCPRISIVTPSYNQGQFLEETIRSVLLQGYPNLEYIIIDGGSTDNTLEIVRKYEPFISYWVSERDRGQSEAVNKGFRRATGQLIGWQNSDDIYQPYALIEAAKTLKRVPTSEIIYGCVDLVDEFGQFLRPYPVAEATIENLIPYPQICNQSSFFHWKIFEGGFYLNEDCSHCMDQEFFLRLLIHRYRFTFESKIKANFRLHQAAKTSQQAEVWSAESFDLYRSLYQNSALSQPFRSRARDCLYGICREDFNKLRLHSFRHKVRGLSKILGREALSFDLLLKYALSFLGKDIVAKFQRNAS